MKCQDAKGLLSPYIDGELTKKQKTLLEEHVADCPHCARELAELRRLVDDLRALKELKAPQDFMAGVHQRLAQEKTASTFRNRFRNSRASWVAAAAAGVALTFGIYISSLIPYQVASRVIDRVPDAILHRQEAPKTDIEKIIKDKERELYLARKDAEKNFGSQKSGSVSYGKKGLEATNLAPTTAMVASNMQAASNMRTNNETVSQVTVGTVDLQVRVSDVARATDGALQVAAINQGQVEKFTPQLMSGQSQGITIWVPKERVDSVVAGLKELGAATAPREGKQAFAEYHQVQTRLQQLDNEIKELQERDRLNSGEEEKLKVLLFEKNYLGDKEVELNQRLNMVAINILIDENTNH